MHRQTDRHELLTAWTCWNRNLCQLCIRWGRQTDRQNHTQTYRQELLTAWTCWNRNLSQLCIRWGRQTDRQNHTQTYRQELLTAWTCWNRNLCQLCIRRGRLIRGSVSSFSPNTNPKAAASGIVLKARRKLLACNTSTHSPSFSFPRSKQFYRKEYDYFSRKYLILQTRA